MFFPFPILTVLLGCSYAYAIQVKPSYGPPSHRILHREYGVPQQMSFREYGPLAPKFNPPKLNYIGGGGSSSGFHEQIKNYYGAPKPFYGPPYKIPQQYGTPSQQYGTPIKPGSTYGLPPQKLQHKPDSSYGPPKTQYGTPPPQALPLIQPASQFKLPHQPATSYGPPPSGPLNIPPKHIYEPPPLNYGPPPLPNFNNVPETTIIVAGGLNTQNHHQQHHYHQQPQQQQQIHIDASGHTHSTAGSHVPFHTACDGWKPIIAPVGAYVEHNHIETQSGYSQVAQTQALASAGSSFSNTQHSGGASTGTGATGPGSTTLISGSGSAGNSLVDGLSDEQLVAVALQSGNFDNNNVVQQEILPPAGANRDFHKHGLNSIEAEALQSSLGSNYDTYNKPPSDSYAPGSKNSHKFNQHFTNHNSLNSFGISGPGGNYGHLALNSRYGSLRPHTPNYGASLQPKGNYRPPPPPHVQASLGIQYGKQTGNLGPFPPHGGAQPNKPVTYRPPVPQGLFETIGATVQHLDKFGVKPQTQVSTYIPPAANEIPQTGPGNLNIEYGAPQQQIPKNIVEQQLPQQQPAQIFIKFEQQRQSGHQHQQQNFNNGVSAVPTLQQVTPQSQYLSPPIPSHPQQQYLPPMRPEQPNFNSDSSYTSNAAAIFDNSAYASTHYNNQFAHGQPLPLPLEQPVFHDCGHGPNFAGGDSFNYQQQQKQYTSGAGTSIAQSIPVAEQHSHFVSGPANSYGPPPTGGNELDHIAYASEKSQVTALPDGTETKNIPDLDGLDVLSAEKSQAIHFHSQEIKNDNTYQVQFGGIGPETANHEEILSADLLQTILNAVEQPQLQHQPLPANHKAESRSDIDIHDEPIEPEDEVEPGVAFKESNGVHVKSHSDNENLVETPADVQELRPIVVKEEGEAKH